VDELRHGGSVGSGLQFGEELGRCALHIDRRAGIAEISYWVLSAVRRRRVAVRDMHLHAHVIGD